MKRKIIFRWIKLLLLIYAIIGIAFYYLQHKILFHPVAIPRDSVYSFKSPYKELNIPYNAQSNINIIQFTTPDSLPRGVVLYFHGNRRNIGRYAEYAPNFTRNGYEVWMIDYPGFGKSTGNFTEANLYEWALQLYKLARAHYPADSIVIYGKSLGTALAAQLASIRNCKRLILETPYYDFPSVVRTWLPVYPLERMMPFKLRTWQYVEKIIAPITIFHGSDDGVIRYSNSIKLRKHLKPTDEFITVDGGAHNNLFQFPLVNQKLDSLLTQ